MLQHVKYVTPHIFDFFNKIKAIKVLLEVFKFANQSRNM